MPHRLHLGRGCPPSSRMQMVSCGCRRIKWWRTPALVCARPGQSGTGHCRTLVFFGKLIRYAAGGWVCVWGSWFVEGGSVPWIRCMWVFKEPCARVLSHSGHWTLRLCFSRKVSPVPVILRSYAMLESEVLMYPGKVVIILVLVVLVSSPMRRKSPMSTLSACCSH